MTTRLPMLIKFAFACVGILFSQSTTAHHSFLSHYDPSASIQLIGSVTKFTFRNPHSFVFLDVKNDAGEVVNWEVELHSRAVLSRMGLSEDHLKIGDSISVTAWPNRQSDNLLVFGIGFVTAEGAQMGQHPEIENVESAYIQADGIERIQGRWKVPLKRATGNISPLPLNQAGKTAIENYDPKTSPANTCEIVNLPTALHIPYLYDIQIEDDEVIIYYEIFNVERRIPIGEDYAQSEVTGMWGSARAAIVSGELVIESKDYPVSGWGLAQAGDSNGLGKDIPSSTAKKLLERYSVSEDGLALTINYELQDVTYLAETYRNTANGDRVTDDETMYEYKCDIESAARFSM